MDEETNLIDLSFLDDGINKYDYNVLIMLNRPFIKEMFLELRTKINYIICADGAANRVFEAFHKEDDDSENEIMPDCIVGDFDSIYPYVHDYYKNKKVKILYRADEETTDLEKCLYFALETISEQIFSYSSSNLQTNRKRHCIIVLGASGGRIDHTLSAYSQVYKSLNNYSYELSQTDIFMMSKSSLSVYLKPGMNMITTTKTWENRNQEYSVIPTLGEGTIIVNEENDNDQIVFTNEKFIKFGELLFFRKKHDAMRIYINVDSKNKPCAFLYSCTLKYHN